MTENELRGILKSNEWQVRCWAARDPNITLDLLEITIRDKDPTVRCYSAMNPRMSTRLLEIALSDEDIGVRYQAYHHRNTTNEMKMIYRLSHIENEDFWNKPYD